MNLIERFLKYTTFDTQSNEESLSIPQQHLAKSNVKSKICLHKETVDFQRSTSHPCDTQQTT